MAEKEKYLYGASVQGIQSFIFQTDKLKEIVGASELVAQICTTAFDEYGRNADSVVRAAGNIKHIFDNEEDCKKAVLHFPRKVMTMAPGITISQAVVKVEADLSDYAAKSDKLEQLLRAQRNKLPRPMTLGLMAIKRVPSTGLPAVKDTKDGLLDEASDKKEVACSTKNLMKDAIGRKPDDKEVAYDIEDITGKNSWIAVVHADGNGLGNIVRSVSKKPECIKQFSGKLDEITTNSAREAYKEVIENKIEKGDKIPFRPVVLGGDDLTIICRADFAIQYTKVFLEKFEEESKVQLKSLILDEESQKIVSKGLTACAGIAFVKSSYPFHYAVGLAESLCSRAKKKAKEIDLDLAPSCLMFHKVQDSFVEDFREIVERELKPQPNLSFENGPYYCGSHAETFASRCDNTIDKLLAGIEDVKKDNAVKSHLRQWLSLLFDNVGAADQKMKRLRTLNKNAEKLIDKSYESLANKKDEITIPFHDILSLASILFSETKKQEDKK